MKNVFVTVPLDLLERLADYSVAFTSEYCCCEEDAEEIGKAQEDILYAKERVREVRLDVIFNSIEQHGWTQIPDLEDWASWIRDDRMLKLNLRYMKWYTGKRVLHARP